MTAALLFLALLGAFAVVLAPVGFVVWVRGLRNAPAPAPFTAAERREFVRREFARPPATDLDEGMRQLAALVIPKGI